MHCRFLSLSRLFRRFCLLVLAMNGLWAHATTVPSMWADFDQLFRQEIDAAAIPGGAYAIVQDGKIAHVAVHGVRARDTQDLVNEQTVFRIASVSKTFAAELTALLVQDGKLRWNDPVATYTPQLQLSSTQHLNALQLQHLLGHSTGIVSNAYDNFLNADVPVQQIVPKFRELKPLCRPGQCYTYQNILFSLIEPAVEKVTHQTYAGALQQRILTPLGMQRTSIGLDAFLAESNRAEPHVKRAGVWIKTKVTPGYYDVKPAAGVNASVSDLAKWLLAQMGSHPHIISPQLVDFLTTKRVRTLKDRQRSHWRELLSDAHYGLGWRIYQMGNEELVLHAGWVKGYVAEIAYSKSRRTGLVVLLNAETNVLSSITAAFWRRQLLAPTEPNIQVSE